MQNLLQLFSKTFWRVSLMFLLFLVVGCGWKITQIRPGVVLIEEPKAVIERPVLEEGYPGKEIEFKVTIDDPEPKKVEDVLYVAKASLEDMKEFKIVQVTGTVIEKEYEEPINHPLIFAVLLAIFLLITYATYYMIKDWKKK